MISIISRPLQLINNEVSLFQSTPQHVYNHTRRCHKQTTLTIWYFWLGWGYWRFFFLGVFIFSSLILRDSSTYSHVMSQKHAKTPNITQKTFKFVLCIEIISLREATEFTPGAEIVFGQRKKFNLPPVGGSEKTWPFLYEFSTRKIKSAKTP